DSSAAYAQASIWATDSTRVVLGGRWQHYSQTLEEKVFPSKLTRGGNLEGYEAALRQGFGSGFSGYAKWTRAFRLATFDENAFNPALLKPQTSDGVEGGLEVERGGLSGRVAAYQIDLENEIYFIPFTFS